MKCIATLLLLFYLAVPAKAETDTGTEADHVQLREMLTSFKDAVNSRELLKLESYLHPDFAITLMTQDVMTKDRPLKYYFDKWFNNEGALLKGMSTQPKASVLTNIYDGKFGVVHGSTVDTYELKDGRTFKIDAKWTATLIKEERAWRLLALHVGVNPLNNAIINGYRSMMGLGGVAIEIGKVFN